jgi:predicted ATP-dependent protease
MSTLQQYEVPWQKICWNGDDSLQFQCTDELPHLDRFIGQRRAIEAVRFGLELDKPGYNLFVTGLRGTGKASVIRSHLQSIVEEQQRQGKQKPIGDWCYVYNFDDSDRPRVLHLSPGLGRTLRSRLVELLRVLREEVPKVFKSEEYEAQRKSLEEAGRQVTQQLMMELERQAQAANFAIQFSPSGLSIFPLIDNRPMAIEEYQRLGSEQKKAIDDTRNRLMELTQDTMIRVRNIEKDASDKLKALERVAADERVSAIFSESMDSWRNIPEVWDYLTRLIDYVLDNLHLFKEAETPPGTSPFPPAGPVPGGMLARNPFIPFELNVLVDNSGVTTAPIIIEANPNWGNLFGRIERRAVMGTYISDHTMLKPGSVHQANGGYLVLNARDMLMSPGVWEGLKRVLQNKEIVLEDPTQQGGFFVTEGLRPEPVPLEMKVILTGDEALYRMLSNVDHEDFWDLFKVKAEFDYRIDRTPENVQAYCAFVSRTSAEEKLLPFDASGVARVVEYGARLVSDQSKLSSRFGLIQDLLIEADYWARKDHSQRVLGQHVQQAIEQKVYRLNLVEERIREMVAEGTLLLQVTGSVVGQVNGLSVYDLGDFTFGRPARITAQTFAGRRGVINIEREVALSGRVHDKGVLILSGYLGARYGQEKPLTLSASLCFEQSYEGIEGDSASSTELYAILSSLSGLPLRQGIAVTGSVNQKGEVQPIGGVNQKIEGMFDVCRLLGLTGDQGVMVPVQNVRNLVLREDVVAAVKEGKFHIYAVKTIDEGMEILTGYPAGERQPDGSYPEGTVNHLVDQRLRELSQSMRGYYGELLAV